MEHKFVVADVNLIADLKKSVYFDHLSQDHSFNIGHPDNLVYTDELLDKLQSKLDNLQCLYCEKTFKDRTVLKEHMRKKQHKRINPKNRSYDKYYVINYLEMGKNWEVIQSEHDIAYDTEGNTDTEDEWEGWEESGSQAVCLFCEFASGNAERLNSHMQELHDLDLKEIKLRMNLNFYQQVKLVNYIRRQVHLGICMGCGETFGGKSELVDHMHQLGHITEIPDISVWDQPQYFFPTYENDNLLCQLDDTADDGCDVIDHHGNLRVIAEDFPVVETILSEESVRKNVLGT
ncbi:hypothetical protein FSP39_015396 [Pinctada imbricata]|uniref:C2H2-type domain-containing protein n=1 Tax=Pinctada imbricata TaxID=66713 RepID=A0AA88YKC0_PINIB|nr:hypothetical protein FSP39_015396 [Pinctada imbricata]